MIQQKKDCINIDQSKKLHDLGFRIDSQCLFPISDREYQAYSSQELIEWFLSTDCKALLNIEHSNESYKVSFHLDIEGCEWFNHFGDTLAEALGNLLILVCDKRYSKEFGKFEIIDSKIAPIVL